LSRPPTFTDHKWLQLPDEILGRYNSFDTYATAKLYGELRQELADNSQLEFFERRVWPLVDVVVAMQRRGLGVNREALNTYRLLLRQEVRETEAKIRAFSARGRDLNLDSPKQKAEFLYNELGLKSPKTTSTGLKSTDQDSLIRVLRTLRKKDERFRPALERLFHRSRLNTIYTRYLNFDIDDDGRVRPTVKLTGTETGRFAYADPPLQQYPKEARHLFKAEEGRVLLCADYTQLEARIMAHLSGDERTLETFRAGDDPHHQNAIDLLGVEDAKKPGAREFAKGWLYRLMYGGGAETAKTKLFCPCPKCRDNLPASLTLTRTKLKALDDKWFELHPDVATWRHKLVRSVVDGDHSYTNTLGRKRYFFSPWPTVEREVLNYPMQSTAADIINRAMIRLHAMDTPLVLQMHDSLMLEVGIGEVSEWASRLKEEMERPIPEMGDMSFPVALSAGTDWGSLREYDPQRTDSLTTPSSAS
jgi:DNA polymerase-1